ncbi:MAG: PCMD domain-containing protein, partial [Muribaculaceae bacterium]|nr:PCMD domain-containing protein [Muribaculaceae bacterium]
MTKVTRIIYPLLAVAIMAGILTGCLKNDIPYPRIQPNIVTLEVEHQSQAAQIDTINRIATVYLDETADINNVNVVRCTLSDKASFVGDSIAGTLDLSQPRYYILQIYQEYVWTLKAVQNITRYFTVANQIGSSVIDVPGRRIVVTLPTTADHSAVKVLTAKLGSEGSVITPAIEGTYIDLTRPCQITVTDYGRSADWTIYCQVTEATVTTVRADAWSNVAWVYGEAQEGRENYIEYRAASDSEWTRVPDSWLTVDGGSFHARIIHLQSLTDYVARAVSGDEYGAEIEFRTGAIIQPENADFNNWWLDGKVWNPWAEYGERYWDTGNKGATTLGSSNTQPSDDTPSGSGLSAKLETKFVGIGMIGKLAAGNIFVGEYVRTDGTNGVLSFGRPFNERPTKLRGYYKYHSAPSSSTTTGFTALIDRPDPCIVW